MCSLTLIIPLTFHIICAELQMVHVLSEGCTHTLLWYHFFFGLIFYPFTDQYFPPRTLCYLCSEYFPLQFTVSTRNLAVTINTNLGEVLHFFCDITKG